MILSMTTARSVPALLFALVLLGAACGTEETTDAGASTDSATEEDVTVDDDDHDDDHDDDDHDDEEGAGLGAHEHGTAEMSIAWIDSEVVIDLISPNFNVFGFEYEPESDEDVAIEEDRTAAITADGVVKINDEAGCSLEGPASTDIEREGSHSEVTVSWVFVCDNPDEISELDASELFAEFPNFEDIDAQWITATEQSASELSPSSPTLTLQG